MTPELEAQFTAAAKELLGKLSAAFPDTHVGISFEMDMHLSGTFQKTVNAYVGGDHGLLMERESLAAAVDAAIDAQ